MLRHPRALRPDQRGQTLTEYIVLIVLVIVSGVVGWTVFRSLMSAKVTSTADVLEHVDQVKRQRDRTAEETLPDRRPDRTAPMHEPSIVEETLSDPETVLIWLFVLFIAMLALFRAMRKHYDEQQDEEQKRLEAARSGLRRETRPFDRGAEAASEGEAGEAE